MTKVSIIATGKVVAGNEKVLPELLKALVEASRKEPGVLFYSASIAKDDPAAFHFYEIYADEAALQTHAAAEALQTFVRTAPPMVEPVKIIQGALVVE